MGNEDEELERKRPFILMNQGEKGVSLRMQSVFTLGSNRI